MSSCSFVAGLSTSQPENQLEFSNLETVSPQDNNTLPGKDVRPYICKMLQSESDHYNSPVQLRLPIE
jgi:hypothetical protein